jgi:hypothetical protein
MTASKVSLVLLAFASFSFAEPLPVETNKAEYRGVSGAELQDERGKIKSGDAARIVEMRDRLVVEVSNLDGWLYDSVRAGYFPKQEWFDPATVKLIEETDLGTLYQKTTLGSNDPQKQLFEQARESVDRMLSDVKQRLYLQLGPARLRHLHAEDPLVRQNESGIFRFIFPIQDTPEDRDEWNKLRKIHGELRPISISLAFDSEGLTHTLRTKLGSSVDSGSSARPEQQFKFQIYSRFTALAFVVVYLVAILIFLWTAGAPNLLRDPDGPLRDGKHVFSLSRCQLAWWFFLILAAWGFLWVTTSSRDTMNQTALILLGIGSATFLSGAIVGDVRATRSGLSKETVSPRPKLFQAKTTAWLYDVLADKDNIGFHRFQLLVWNIVLGIVFLYQTWIDFAMPEFNATLLALLGLSGATFVGMKMTANE